MSDSVWPMIFAEREAFVEYVRTLAPNDWERPSLCEGWRVKDVIAHLIAGARNTPLKFPLNLIAAGFNFDKMNAQGVRREGNGTPAELTTRLAALVTAKTYPPAALLGEIVVHGEDVRRALGAPVRDYPAAHLRTVADYYKKAGAPLHVKRRISGLQLQATDVDWSTGDGPAVKGPLLALLLAMAGRRAGLDGLGGPGLDELKRRLSVGAAAAAPA